MSDKFLNMLNICITSELQVDKDMGIRTRMYVASPQHACSKTPLTCEWCNPYPHPVSGTQDCLKNIPGFGA